MKLHEKTVFQFSGGKDSIACLLLLKDRLSEITVLWTDTGDSFPETLAQMERIRAMCPNFVVAHGNQPADIAEHGYPVDILPIRNHAHVQAMTGIERTKMQPFLDCCYKNMMRPMHEATLALGATMIIRGQKASDGHKSPIKSGDIVDGIEYYFPIEGWTDEQVMDFIKDSPLLPDHYQTARTSLDCMHCTAYLDENRWKLPYLEENHPEHGKEVRARLIQIKNEIAADMRSLNDITGVL